MTLPAGLPVVDHHCHLSPSGEGVAAARRFRAAGGTHLFLATQTYGPSPPRSLAEYAHQFETTEALARQVRTEVGVVVYPVIAPYPVDLVRQTAELGPDAALGLHLGALDLAGRWVRERRAVALGEVGRAHFPVSEEVRGAIEAAFRHALEVARESDCPVVVHSDDLGPSGIQELGARGQEARLPPGRVIKHYARARFAPSDRGSVTPSYLARRELVREVRHDPAPWFLETDFLDDPARPGAVLDLATVPRRAAAIASAAPAEVELLYGPFVDSVERVYGFRPSVEPGGGG